jgi:ABC-type amino acid transport substrate-binding protein
MIFKQHFPKRFGDIAMTNAQHANENMTVHIKVKDYATWRTAYDAREKGRVSAGITNGRVFRNAEDPNDVVILQDVADVAKARTWFGSDDLKAAMLKSGVVGSPNVRFAAAQ